MPISRFTEFSPTGRPKVPRLSMTTEPISWPPMTQTKKQERACDRGNYQATSNIENTDHTCQIYPPGHAAQRPEIDFAAVTANEDKCDSDQAGQTDCHGSGAIRASDCAGQNGIQKRLNGDERSKKDRCRQVRNRIQTMSVPAIAAVLTRQFSGWAGPALCQGATSISPDA